MIARNITRTAITVVVLALAASACSATPVDPPAPDFTVGLVTNNPNGMRNIGGFVEGMAELGYVEGDNVTYLFADEPVTGDALVAELDAMVAGGVDLIFTAGTPTGVAAYEATLDTDIPVVFGVIADPIRAGVMTDLTHPRGNLTGVKTGADHSRRLELLLELDPHIEHVVVPFNPGDAAAMSAVEQVRAMAPQLGVELMLVEARDDAAVTAALADMPAGADAVFLVPDSVVNSRLDDILAVANARQLPTSGPSTAQVEDGALTAFGFVHHEAGRQAARIADRVLKGADPGTLPVEDTESFLAVNLKTARTIGLEIADEWLRRASVVIREEGATS